MMNEWWKPTSFLTLFGFALIGYWWNTGEVSITGDVRPPTVLIEHDVILSCQVRGCSSSSLEIWIYKWGHSRKDALYIYSGPKQDKTQESSTGERHENRTHRGQFKDGVLEVTLFQVQTADSGLYMCAMTCDRVYKEVTLDVIVTDLINATVGEDVILPCHLKEIHELFHWKLQWRRISPGKNEAIYSYLYLHPYQDTCPAVYSKDSLYHQCSNLTGPIIREHHQKKYKGKAEVSIRKGTLKLNRVKKEETGTYQCSVRSTSFNKTIIFKLSTEGRKNISEIHDQNMEILKFYYLGRLYVLFFFMLLMFFCSAANIELQMDQGGELQKHEIQAEEDEEKEEKENDDEEERRLRNKIEEQNHNAEELQNLRKQNEFLEARFCRVDVILDPGTAHPRLEVSQDGKCVRDTGNVLSVPDNEERFDSHMFVLAKEGFVKGKHYWEVEVGQKKNWDLGVASESISRKGRITLAPQNGYWVIGLDGKKDYWARTDPWTRLEASGKPTKIGMYLNIPERTLSFYDVNRRNKLHTFTLPSSGKKLYPFFSLGSVTEQLDSHSLEIPPWFKEEDVTET